MGDHFGHRWSAAGWKIFALACARAGADVVIHHGHSEEEAQKVREEVTGLGRRAWVFEADFNDPSRAESLIPRINESTPLHGLVNSAAIFGALSLENTPSKTGKSISRSI